MSKRRIIILGAGLAGLSAAWHLQKEGQDCLVFEKEPEVGGLCRSKKIGGFTFDYDGHLLHFRHRYAFDLVKSLLGNNLAEHKRSAWVYSSGRYIRYPFQANLHTLPAGVIQECILGLISRDGKFKGNKDNNFLEWIHSTFGKGIARHFMVPYNTKFWTVHPREMTCAWLGGRVPRPSLRQIVQGAIEESQREFGYNSRFWYPKKGGISQLPDALAGNIRGVRTGCAAKEINLAKKEITLASGDKEKFDYLIFTMPLPELPHIIKDLPKDIQAQFKKLKWNSIFNLNLGAHESNLNGKHWIYFPARGTSFFRLGSYTNFSASLAPADKKSLYVEISYSKDKPINKGAIIAKIMKDIEKIGILKSRDEVCLEDTNDIKYGYPIYDQNYLSARGVILKYLQGNKIFACGRYGSWKYMSMEDALLDGRRMLEFFRR